MTRVKDFEDTIYNSQLQELLTIPFYLVSLVELYKDNNRLPQSKYEIFEHLVGARIIHDIAHFRTTISLEDKRKTVIETLERLALGMETLGRNYVTDDEYQRLIPDSSQRSLIKYCTLLNKNKQEEHTWQFEHNNFQEFLAARVLSRQSLEVIKGFISFKPQYQKIIPSWVNTLSFLFSILDEQNPLFKQIFGWIENCEPELAVKFEPDKVKKSTRVHIFRNIFNYYKERQIWIDRDKYQVSELARFAQSNETIDFLLSEINSATHYTSTSLAIELLYNSRVPPNKRKRATELLVKCSLNENNNEVVQNGALIALAKLNLNSKEVINQIVSKLRLSDNDWVRYGLYYFLHNSDYLDENIDIFLEGFQYVYNIPPMFNKKESRLGDEHWHLIRGLEKAKAPEAIRKILRYFQKNPRLIDNPYFEKRISSIIDNAALAHFENPSILKIAVDLYVTLVTNHLESEAKEFSIFFDKTKTRFRVFKILFKKRNTLDDSFLALASVADKKAIEFFAKQYNKTVTDNDILTFQNYLEWNNSDFFMPFNKLINQLSDNKFVLPKKRDFQKERNEQKKRDISLLFDKRAFLKELKTIFNTEKKRTFTRKELTKVAAQRRENLNFSEIARRTLQELAGEGTITIDVACKFIEKNWDLFWIRKLSNDLDRNISLSIEQNKVLANWCYSNLDYVDFKTALITVGDNQSRTNERAIYLWYYLRKLKLQYPTKVLLNMISFDWIEGSQMLGIRYLEDLLDEPDMTTRILDNLSKGIDNYNVLKNHIDYCRRHKIYEVLPYALEKISDENTENEVRNVALETVCELSENLSELEELLPEIGDEYLWNVVEKLVEIKSKVCHSFLIQVINNDNEQDQFKASEYLIHMQDLAGLEYYVKWIKRHKKFPYTYISKSPLSALRNKKAIPLLIKLLRVSYIEDIIQDEFMPMSQAVMDSLTIIGLESDHNYSAVREAVENFIDKYSANIEGVNFLNSSLDRFEHRYYVSSSEKLDIDDVIKKLDSIM